MPLKLDSTGHLSLVGPGALRALPTFEERLRARLELFCAEQGLPSPVREYQLVPHRRFRGDLCWPTYRVCIEAMGGTWSGGRHVRGEGYERDLWKCLESAASGWVVLGVTPKMIANDWEHVTRALVAVFKLRGLQTPP